MQLSPRYVGVVKMCKPVNLDYFKINFFKFQEMIGANRERFSQIKMPGFCTGNTMKA